MSDQPDEPGNFSADIPQDAIDAAMRSVSGVRKDEPEEGEVAVEVEAPLNPDQERIKRLTAMFEDSVQRGAQTQERLKDAHERMLRVAADFENWKKRSAKEREETLKFANERLLKDILPVADNLERALAAGEQQNVLDGVKLVLKQFNDVLGRFGVKSFTALGEQFDPSRHEALMAQESDAPPNTVVSEMSKGYTLNDRLIRPAAVVVAAARSVPPSADPPPVAEAAPVDPPAEAKAPEVPPSNPPAAE